MSQGRKQERGRNAVRLLAATVLFILIFSMAAFAKPAVSKKKMTIYTGSKATVSIKGTSRSVSWKSSNSSVVRIVKKSGRTVTIQGVKAGTSKVYTKIGKKSYTCVVSVKTAPVSGKSGQEQNAAPAALAQPGVYSTY